MVVFSLCAGSYSRSDMKKLLIATAVAMLVSSCAPTTVVRKEEAYRYVPEINDHTSTGVFHVRTSQDELVLGKRMVRDDELVTWIDVNNQSHPLQEIRSIDVHHNAGGAYVGAIVGGGVGLIASFFIPDKALELGTIDGQPFRLSRFDAAGYSLGLGGLLGFGIGYLIGQNEHYEFQQ